LRFISFLKLKLSKGYQALKFMVFELINVAVLLIIFIPRVSWLPYLSFVHCPLLSK